MTEEEEFQYVVSKEDYSDFKTSQAKCQELAKLLKESELLHSQDKEDYLLKIDKLQDQLKSYKISIRQYVDREVRQVDSLLKILHDYKSLHSKSSIDEKTFNRMKSECDKIAQTFNPSLKNLEILNSEVINVIKSLIEDSLALQQKLKEFSQRYENAMDEREDLYEKLRRMNEKEMFSEKEREKLLKSEQKFKNQSQILRIHLKQKEDQNIQNEIHFETTKNKFYNEIKALKEEIVVTEKKWKEKLEFTEKKMQRETADLRNEKLISTKTMIEEIQKLREKCKFLAQECLLKSNKIQGLQVAYKQQSEQFANQKNTAKQTQALLNEELQRSRAQNEKIASRYETEISELTSAYDERFVEQEKTIRELQQSLKENSEISTALSSELNGSRQTIVHLNAENQKIRDTLLSENISLAEQIQRSQEEINKKSIHIASWGQELQKMKNQLQDYVEKYKLQFQTLERLKKQSIDYQQTICSLKAELAMRTQQIKKTEHESSRIHHSVSQQIQQMKRNIAICETEKTYHEDKVKYLTEQLLILKKSTQEEKNKLQFTNEQLSTQLNIMASNVDKRSIELQDLQKAYIQIKSAKKYAEDQFYSLRESFEQEKKKNQELKNQLTIINTETNLLRQDLEQSQMSNESLLKEIDSLRDQARSSRQVEEASHLLKMNADTLQTEVERLHKENNMLKKERDVFCHDLNSLKEETKFLTDDVNSMRMYIEELEQNLEKLSEEKSALKNEVFLFKEEAEYCKKESIEQLGIIDKLERELQTTKRELKHAFELSEPASIVKRSSLSKGEKSYYVKEMIQEYSNEMKKNLEEMGALSHEEVNELICSDLMELANFVKKLEKEFQ